MISERFSRMEQMVGSDALVKLKESKVAVFGIGGVGSYVVEALARAGIGELILVDSDVVEITNINRQLHALENTLGREKVFLMAERAKLINPEIKVHPIKGFYEEKVGLDFLMPGISYVVDAIDTVSSKISLIKNCLEAKIPIVSSMGTGNKMDPTAFQVDDLAKTSVCPLAKVLRRELKKLGITKGVKVVYSTEQPVVKTAVPGSISFVPGCAGLILASVVIRDILYNSENSNI